jgi:hypothetical protein
LLESGEYGQSDILEHYFNSYLPVQQQRQYREAFEASKVGAAEANVVSEDFPVPEEEFRTYVDDMVQLIESENFVDDYLKAGGAKALKDAKELQTEQLANLNDESAFKGSGLSQLI